VGRQDAVIEEQIDPGAWYQSGELFQELEGPEMKMRSTVRPGAAKLKKNVTCWCQLQAFLRDRWT